MSINHMTWAMAKSQYEKGTLQSEHPRVEEPLDKASFNSKVVLLVLYLLGTITGAVGLVFFGMSGESEIMTLIMLSITLVSGLLNIADVISRVIEHKNKIEEDENITDQPYLQKLLTKRKHAPEEMVPTNTFGG